MTSAQLILVSVSSALIAVIAMLVVATVLRARTRESTGGDVPQSTGRQTRAQRAAARAQKKAQRATIKAERKAAKAAASVAKAEKAKAEKAKAENAKAAALVAAKTESPGDMSPSVESAEVSEKAPDDNDTKSGDAGENEPGAPEGASPSEEAAGSSVTAAAEIPSAAGETDVLAVPEKKEDEVATTEAGKRASEARPRARRSLLGRRGAGDDSPEEKS
jgi:hypothetical protein